MTTAMMATQDVELVGRTRNVFVVGHRELREEKQQRSCLRWMHPGSILAKRRMSVPTKRYIYSLVNCRDIFDWRRTSRWTGTFLNTFSDSLMGLPIVGSRHWTRELHRFVGRSLRRPSGRNSSPENMFRLQ